MDHIEGCPGRNLLHKNLTVDPPHNSPCSCPCHDGVVEHARGREYHEAMYVAVHTGGPK